MRFGAPRRREFVAVRLAVAGERLRSLLARRKLGLGARERALSALSPRNVLERGYSITAREGDHRPVKDAAAVNAGERVVTTLAHGQLRSLVLGRSNGTQGSLFEESGTGLRAPGTEKRAQDTRRQTPGDGDGSKA